MMQHPIGAANCSWERGVSQVRVKGRTALTVGLNLVGLDPVVVLQRIRIAHHRDLPGGGGWPILPSNEAPVGGDGVRSGT